MLPHNAQGLPSYMLVNHSDCLPYSFLSVVSAVQCCCGRVLPSTGICGWPGLSGRQLKAVSALCPRGAGDAPQRGFPHGCTGLCAPARRLWHWGCSCLLCTHSSPPLPKDTQCSLSSLQRWAVLMHSTVLQAHLHWVVKTGEFFWMPSGLPRLPARAVMDSLAVPSEALAAIHEGPRLWVPVIPGRSSGPGASAHGSRAVFDTQASASRGSADPAGQVAGAGLLLGVLE